MSYDRWIDCLVENIAAPQRNALVGGPFGSNLVSRDYVATGVPVIRGQNMGLGRWVAGEFAYVSDSKAADLSPNTAHPGDLIFTQRGTLGQVALVPGRPYDRYVISQSQMKLTVDRNKADSRYVYYVFTSQQQQKYIIRNAIQTGVPHTNLEHLRKTPLRLPPLLEQKSIASVLGALDDKIELNQRMNETLEGMARALFRSWFVDFDPARAKAEGRQPFGMDAETAALFPDSFEDSALGEIPSGWRAGSLGEIAENPRRIVEPTAISPDTSYIGLEQMPRGHIGLAEWGCAGDTVSAKARFYSGEILFGKLRPYFHKVGVAPLDGVCSTDILVVRPKAEAWFGLVLGHFSSAELIAFTHAHSAGTRMPRVSWLDLATYRVARPPEVLAARFTSLIRPLIGRIRSNIMEARVLVTVRDTLLPKLLSGEIRVKEAEKLGEAAV